MGLRVDASGGRPLRSARRRPRGARGSLLPAAALGALRTNARVHDKAGRASGSRQEQARGLWEEQHVDHGAPREDARSHESARAEALEKVLKNGQR